jgi:hypothetical protein
MKLEPKEKEFKRFESIEELNAFLCGGAYPYGHESMTIDELLTDYGRLREFYCAVHSLVGEAETVETGAVETGAVEAGEAEAGK